MARLEQVFVYRYKTPPGADTFSRVVAPRGLELYGVELPWVDVDKDGKRDHNVSRIVAGKYRCDYTASSSRKNADGSAECSYLLRDVPDADGVRIHSANWADQLKACLAFGRAIMDIKRPDGSRRRGVSSSRDAVSTFESHMNRKPFELVIIDTEEDA